MTVSLGQAVRAVIEPPDQEGRDPALVEAVRGDDETQLRAAIRSTLGTAPAKAAAQYRLAKETGVPLGTVQRNEDEVRRRHALAGLDAPAILRDTPKLAARLKDPATAPIVLDDIDHLSYAERWWGDFKQAARTGFDTKDVGELGVKDWLGQELSPTEQNRLNEIRGRKKQDFEIGFVPGIPGAVVEMAPTMFEAIKDAIPYAAAGAVTGFAATRNAVGAGAGAKLGLNAGVAIEMGKAELGAAWLEFKDIKDADGKPLDPDVARGAALMVGITNGLLEKAGFNAIAKQFPGADKVLARLSKGALKDYIKKGGPAVQTLKRIGASIAEAGSIEGATELLQESSNILFGELAKALSSGNFEAFLARPEGAPETEEATFFEFLSQSVARAAEAGVRGAQGGIGMGGGGAVFSETVDAHNRRMAHKREQQALADAVASAATSKTLKLDPNLWNEMTADTLGEQSVYLDAKAAMTFFQTAQVQFKDFAALVPEASEQMAEAIERGGDLVLPANRVVAALAQVKELAALQPGMRLTPEAVTEQEYQDTVLDAISREQKGEPQAAAAVPTFGEAVERRLTEEATATGFNEGTARLYSQTFRAMYETQAKRLANNPDELAKLNQSFERLRTERGTDTPPPVAEGQKTLMQRLKELVTGKKPEAVKPDDLAPTSESQRVTKELDAILPTIEVDLRAVEAETGKHVIIKEKADVALKDIDGRIARLEGLLKCAA